jgi:hypothetical protein
MPAKRRRPCWNRVQPRSRYSCLNKIGSGRQFAHDAVGNQIERPNETITYTKGGDGDPSNGDVLCRDCNLEKGDQL